jgi:hypothetical protein
MAETLIRLRGTDMTLAEFSREQNVILAHRHARREFWRREVPEEALSYPLYSTLMKKARGAG